MTTFASSQTSLRGAFCGQLHFAAKHVNCNRWNAYNFEPGLHLDKILERNIRDVYTRSETGRTLTVCLSTVKS
jgi:hypothetical protein